MKIKGTLNIWLTAITMAVVIVIMSYVVYSYFIKQPTTVIFLLYNNEDISNFQYPNIVPYKIYNQTVFFESEAYRKMEDLPNVANIGFITPSFFRKQNRSFNEVFKEIGDEPLRQTLGLVEAQENRLAFLTKFHGENFIIIWKWLIVELGYPEYINIDFKGFSANMWVANRNFVLRFLVVVKRAIHICENAPDKMKKLLYSDSHYNGSIKHLCMEKFGVPHYPFHPFILENLPCFLSHLDRVGLPF